jgi:hypothetical protein
MCIIPARKPSTAPISVANGVVCQWRSIKNPMPTGRENSNPIVVIEEASWTPVASRACPSGRSATHRELLHSPPLPQTTMTHARTDVQSKPAEGVKNLLEDITRCPIYTGQFFHVNRPAAKFEKIFTNSRYEQMR